MVRQLISHETFHGKSVHGTMETIWNVQLIYPMTEEEQIRKKTFSLTALEMITAGTTENNADISKTKTKRKCSLTFNSPDRGSLHC